jgi:ribosome biogenesis GTPase A
VKEEPDKDLDFNVSKILSTSETLTVLRSMVPKETSPTLTVGFLGYPNVGKSSTINKFLNCKRLQVNFCRFYFPITVTSGLRKYCKARFINIDAVLEK